MSRDLRVPSISSLPSFTSSDHSPFKMVVDLTYSHDFILPPKVSTLVSLVDYQDKDRLITRDTPNYVDGRFHTTCTRGFGGYGSEMYLAVPSYNPDPRIRLHIPGERVVNGEGLREAGQAEDSKHVV
jgi:hypothetical protein